MPNAPTQERTASAAFDRPLADYRAWLVDLDGTLYRPLGVKLAMAAELAALGWRDIRVIRAFRREHERMRETLTNGRANLSAAEVAPSSAFEQQIQRTALGLAMSEPAVERTVHRWMFERPGKWLRLFRRRGLIAHIERHRERGGRTALVSDYPATCKLAALRAAELFEVVIANGERGAAFALKPDPAAYLAAAERLATPPNDCVVIGDRDDADGQAARAAGMAFCHVKSMAVVPPR